MSPRSSIATRRLTSTFAAASRREPAARAVVTTAGSSCGVIPTAIARAKSNDSTSGRPRMRFAAMMNTVRTIATCSSSTENRDRPFWNAVCGGSSPRPAATAPNSACAPVATTIPVAVPDCTTVPMYAQLVRSANGVSAGSGSICLAAAVDSPVSTPSLQSRSVTSVSRMSAGTSCPSTRRTTSPTTSPVTSIVCAVPSRITVVLWCTRSCSASVAFAARYSLTNPPRTLAARMMPITTASLRSPSAKARTAVAISSTIRALRNWLTRMCSGRTCTVCRAFGPSFMSRVAASAEVRPPGPVSSALVTSLVVAAQACVTMSDDAPLRGLSVDGPLMPLILLFHRRLRYRGQLIGVQGRSGRGYAADRTLPADRHDAHPASHAPCRPAGTRCGRSMVAIGPDAGSSAESR